MIAAIRFSVGLSLAGLSLAPAASPQATPTDSLRAELARLRARLDSLEQLLRTRGEALPPDTGGGDELARLRARAQAAAAQADTVPRGEEQAGPGNLNQLNPEISVTGDVRASLVNPGPQENPFDPREFEFAFQSILDPFASTKVFLTFEEGALDLEEGYLYWPGLPGRVRLDVGKFRQQFGELNRWHLHALPESEYPLVIGTYFGDEGLAQTGASLYWVTPAWLRGGSHELWLQVAVGDNPGLFDEGNRASYLGHLNNFWQLSPSTFVQLGGTGMYGENPDASLATTAAGIDWRLTWRPPQQALYRELTLRGEAVFLRRDGPVSDAWRWGGYLGAQYRMGRRWIAGLRYDYVQAPEGDPVYAWAVVPTLTFWQSEWVYLRGEFTHLEDPELGRTQRFQLQIVWSFGPHKHETY